MIDSVHGAAACLVAASAQPAGPFRGGHAAAGGDAGSARSAPAPTGPGARRTAAERDAGTRGRPRRPGRGTGHRLAHPPPQRRHCSRRRSRRGGVRRGPRPPHRRRAGGPRALLSRCARPPGASGRALRCAGGARIPQAGPGRRPGDLSKALFLRRPPGPRWRAAPPGAHLAQDGAMECGAGDLPQARRDHDCRHRWHARRPGGAAGPLRGTGGAVPQGRAAAGGRRHRRRPTRRPLASESRLLPARLRSGGGVVGRHGPGGRRGRSAGRGARMAASECREAGTAGGRSALAVSRS